MRFVRSRLTCAPCGLSIHRDASGPQLGQCILGGMPSCSQDETYRLGAGWPSRRMHQPDLQSAWSAHAPARSGERAGQTEPSVPSLYARGFALKAPNPSKGEKAFRSERIPQQTSGAQTHDIHPRLQPRAAGRQLHDLGLTHPGGPYWSDPDLRRHQRQLERQRGGSASVLRLAGGGSLAGAPCRMLPERAGAAGHQHAKRAPDVRGMEQIARQSDRALDRMEEENG